MKNIKPQSGLAALLTIIIIGAASLIIAKSTAIISLGEMDMAWSSDQGGEVLVMAEGCAEETMRRFQLDEDYSATDFVLSLGSGTCTINTSAAGSERTINIAGNISDYYKNIELVINVSSSTVGLISWGEIGG